MAPAVERFVIHPAIGVARVGNSPDEYYIGPEVPRWRPAVDASAKDIEGRIKRQAARFRCFGLDRDGHVVLEATAETADIEWSVHLANQKAAWYRFDLALDIPEAMGIESSTVAGPTPKPVSNGRRNASVRGDDRRKLVIDPGRRSICGANTNPDGGLPEYAFDTGKFFDASVPLGDLRTDANGNLLVLGGFGRSGNTPPYPPANSFANNDGWYDDTSDGPVDAVVTYDGKRYRAQGAWVLVAPPDFSPGLRPIVTMYTCVREAGMPLEGPIEAVPVSFHEDILPTLSAHVGHQWVNLGFAREFGAGGPSDFLDPATLRKLADPSDSQRLLRSQVFRRFRDPAYKNMEYNSLPPLYGDGMDVPAKDPRQWLSISPLQYDHLRRWAEGEFVVGVEGLGATELDFASILLQARPSALDRAALENCVGGPFHPGCEATWPLRHTLMYDKPFRFRRRMEPEPDWGDALTSKVALHARGPLYASAPGAVTRWMALPWQTDTSSCLSAYDSEVDEYLPTFWPVRAPNDVLTDDDYQTVMGDGPGRDDAFHRRRKWLRTMIQATLPGSAPYPEVINSFVTNWYRYGIIAPRPGPEDGAFPATIWVETGRSPELASEGGPSVPPPLLGPDPEVAGLWFDTDHPNPRLMR